MKKSVLAVTLGAMLAASTTGLASVPVGQIALGGITPGMSVGAVRQACGAPVYEDRETMTFANGLVVKIDDDRPGIVDEVMTVQNGGPATPAGITVGMSANELSNVYGMADKVDVDYDDTEYTYRSNDYTCKLEFNVINGIIVKIKCDLRD